MSTQLKPARAVKPGDILREELEERGWTQKDFANIIGRSPQVVNEIVGGKKSITPETAAQFAAALGMSAELWLNLESVYQLSRVSSDSSLDEVTRTALLYEAAPVKELITRGWISGKDDAGELQQELLAFLGLADLSQVDQLAARFRLSGARTPEDTALISWLRRAEILAYRRNARPYEPDALRRAASDLRCLSLRRDQMAAVSKRVAELGVRLVIVPHLSKTYVDGAAFWLDASSPVVALSVRYNRIDNFWFTLMHELAHIVLHADSDRKAFVDKNLQGIAQDKHEAEANAKAGEWLVSPEEYAEFDARRKGYYSGMAIRAFADELGIHSAILVGRIHHATGNYRLMRRLLEPVCEPAELERIKKAA